MATLPRLASTLITLVVLGGALAPAPPEPPGEAVPGAMGINVPLAKEQLKLIDQIDADLDRMLRGGEIGGSDPGLVLWSRRRVDALRASRASKAELIAAIEEHLLRTKNREARVKIQHTAGSSATRIDVLAAGYERLEAEMWLNQEKAR